LVIQEEEFLIRSREGRPYRCDLRGTDKAGKTVLIELKLRAEKEVVYQIAKYRTYTEQGGRYMVVALNIATETDEILHNLGFETKVLDEGEVLSLLSRERHNPALYQRIFDTKLSPDGQARRGMSKPSYTGDEYNIARAFLQDMEGSINQNVELVSPFSVQGLDIRQDKFRLMLYSTEFPSDRLLIYTRARKRDEIHLMYVPDFSFSTKKSTHRKVDFAQYIRDKESVLTESLCAPLLSSPSGYTDTRLEVTSQAWKGFSFVFIRDVSLWNLPDFTEILTHKFFDYCEVVIPFVRQFQAEFAAKR